MALPVVPAPVTRMPCVPLPLMMFCAGGVRPPIRLFDAPPEISIPNCALVPPNPIVHPTTEFPDAPGPVSSMPLSTLSIKVTALILLPEERTSTPLVNPDMVSPTSLLSGDANTNATGSGSVAVSPLIRTNPPPKIFVPPDASLKEGSCASIFNWVIALSNNIVSGPGSALASSMAARNVVTPEPGTISATPSPGIASPTSTSTFTVKVAACAVAPVPATIKIAANSAAAFFWAGPILRKPS